MAILNSLLRGQLKGRMGNQWFAHAKNAQGRPVTRTGTINSSPNNPQSYDQMLRRAKFANAVKFYKHSQQNFFKFAFENKRANETDYNAFMRFNIDRSPILPKEFVDDPNFPAIAFMCNVGEDNDSAPWLVSSGSLSRSLTDDNGTFGIGGSTSDDAGFLVALGSKMSLGEFCSYLVQIWNCQQGDIVTIVVIGLPDDFIAEDNGEVKLLHPSSVSAWTTYQFIVNVMDSRDIMDIAFSPHSGYSSVQDIGAGYYSFVNARGTTPSCAFVTVTRKQGNKLLSVASKWFLEDSISTMLGEYIQGHSVEERLEDWYATDQATLEGGVADPTGLGDTSTTPSVSRITVNSTAHQTLSALPASSNQAFKVYGKNLSDLSPSDFTVVGGNPTIFQYIEGTWGSLIIKMGTTAGNFSIAYNGTTYLTGTVVASS